MKVMELRSKRPTPGPEGIPSMFTMTIEPVTGGPAVEHGFHLGTDETVARQLAEERCRHGVAPEARTVALHRDGRIIDVFDGGEWQSDLLARTFADEEVE